MYSIAAPHAKGKSAEDNIFAANNRAIALAKEIGVENVTNATVGSILDEDGSLVVLDVVKQELKNLTPPEFCAYAPIKGYDEFRKDTSMPAQHLAAPASCTMSCTIIPNQAMKCSLLTGTGALMTA